MFSKKAKADCPFWRGPCREHECRLYVQIQGKLPQSEEIVNRWDCSFAWLPFLLIENSQQQRQTGAAVESFRNEMVKYNELNLATGARLEHGEHQPRLESTDGTDHDRASQ